MRENSSEITKYIHIARENHKKGNIYQANEIYKKLINQKIYTYDLLFSYGLFNKEINNLKIAKNLFILSIKKYPSEVKSYILLAEILRKENNVNDALKALLAAKKIEKFNSDIDYNLSLTYKTINSFQEAILSIDSAINKQPENQIYKKKSDFSSYKRSNSKTNSNMAFTKKAPGIYQDNANNKNFDDWIWGKHSVFETLSSDRAINRIWCTSEIFSSDKFYILLKDLKAKGVLIEEVSWNRLSQLTYGASHQGVALQLACSKTISLEQLIDFSKLNCSNPVLVALDGITDPHNVGAIIRSAEAFDCKGVIIPQRRSAGLTGTVAKVAAGALEHLHVTRVVNLNRALEELKKNGFLVVGLSGDGQITISNFQEKAPLVVVVGSEDKGISLLTQKKCDFLLRIPLKGKTSSLNASVAAAISLFHLTSK